MALVENPHHSHWWGFCFPACRTSPPIFPWPHLYRLAGLFMVIQTDASLTLGPAGRELHQGISVHLTAPRFGVLMVTIMRQLPGLG